MENRTSTCLLYDSCHEKINYCVIELCFKCRLVNEARMIVLVKADMPANQLASTNDCKFYQKLCKQTFLFFSGLKRYVFFNVCVCHKKGVSAKHPICENNTYHVFIKDIIGKTVCYMRSFFSS